MFSRNRDDTSRERNHRRNDPAVHSVLAVFSSKEPQPDRTDRVGVSTYLALTFGTLLSSQGTDASFVLTLAGFPPGASLRSCVSDSIRSFRPDFLGAFRGPASAFPFPAVPTLSEILSRISPPLSGDGSDARGGRVPDREES